VRGATRISSAFFGGFLIIDGSSKPYVELSDEEKLAVDKSFFKNFLNSFSRWIKV
jgi:hypothetical protein